MLSFRELMVDGGRTKTGLFCGKSQLPLVPELFPLEPRMEKGQLRSLWDGYCWVGCAWWLTWALWQVLAPRFQPLALFSYPPGAFLSPDPSLSPKISLLGVASAAFPAPRALSSLSADGGCGFPRSHRCQVRC